MFRTLDSVSVFMWNPLNWAQYIELVSLSLSSDTSKNTNGVHENNNVNSYFHTFKLLVLLLVSVERERERETSSIHCYQLIRFHLMVETESSLRNVLF
jgi:hypothetical protein